MEGGGSSSNLFSYPVNQRPSELEMLQKEHEEKTRRIQELREEIAETKSRLEIKKKENPGAEEKLEAFRGLVARYNSMRTEYNGLLTEKIKKERN